jgi:hypothetical protein
LQKSSQLRACELACHALRAAKHNVSFRVFNGGHDPALWKEDLALALGWATQALEKPHELRQPQTQDEWEQYHRIRRRVLWERRGLIGVYDENHPDERLPGRYPFLLVFCGSTSRETRQSSDGLLCAKTCSTQGMDECY